MATKDQKEKLGMIIRGMKRLDKIKSDYLEQHYPGNNYTKHDLDSYEFWEKEKKFVDSWIDDFPKDNKSQPNYHKTMELLGNSTNYNDLDLL